MLNIKEGWGGGVGLDARKLGSTIFHLAFLCKEEHHYLVRWGVAGRKRPYSQTPNLSQAWLGATLLTERNTGNSRKDPPPPPAEKAEHHNAFSVLSDSGIGTIKIVLEIPSGSFNRSKPVKSAKQFNYIRVAHRTKVGANKKGVNLGVSRS